RLGPCTSLNPERSFRRLASSCAEAVAEIMRTTSVTISERHRTIVFILNSPSGDHGDPLFRRWPQSVWFLLVRGDRRASDIGTSPSRLLKNLVCERFSAYLRSQDKGEKGGDPRRMRGHGYRVASCSTRQTDSSRCSQELRDANEIV